MPISATSRTAPLRALIPLFLVFGLLLSGGLAWQAERAAQATDLLRFERLTDRLQTEITHRIQKLKYGVRGARSLWPASKSVERIEFAAMVASRDLAVEFPGALGIGFIRRVERADVPSFLEATRADNAPAFQLKTSGNAPDLYVIEFIEPRAANAASEGFDIGQEHNRRTAADRAMLTGAAAITQKITLVQAEKKGAGFLILFPVYKNGAQTVTPEQRQKALLGWTYMPITAAEVLGSITHSLGGEIDFEVFDGDTRQRDRLIFDADSHLSSGSGGTVTRSDYSDRRFHSFVPISIGGEVWTVAGSTTPTFQPSSRMGVYGAAVGGPLLTLLLSGLVLNLSRTTRKAQNLAEVMTADLSAAMRKSEMLAIVATRTTNAVIITDAQRRITWVNEGFTRITGYTAEEAIGQSPGTLLQCSLSDLSVVAAMRAAFDKCKHFRGEILNRSKAGRDYWIEIDVVPLHDHQNQHTGFIAIQLEITERKQAEALLKEQATRTELALEAGGLGLWDWHVPTDHVIFDDRWASMLGEDVSALRCHTDEWSSRCHPEDLPVAHAAVQRHFAGETPLFQCLHRLKHRSGSWRWIITCGKVVLRSADGQPLRMVGTHQDVTAQHLARLELDRNAAALIHTSRLARVGSWEFDIATTALTWSDQVRALHEVPADYTPELTRSLGFYDGAAADTIHGLIQTAIDHGTPFDVELPFVSAQGTRLWVRTVGEAHRPSGVTLLLRGALQDITESYRQREALAAAKAAAEAATRAKADFLANMSHEIRTPMNAVIGMTELLQHTPLTPEQAEFVGTIHTSGDALLALINDILDFSKIDSGSLDLEHIPVNLRDCVESALDLTARPAAAKGLDLLVWIEPDVPPAIFGDITRLRQVVTNLLSNAIKFTEHGEVLISLSSQPEKRLRFAVRDTGIGIPADRLDRLFKSFSQVDTSTTREYGGTGLGLAICQRLVALMGGRIWVDSVTGNGSTFTFEIPCEAAPYCPRPYNSATEPSFAGRRLLIVDDNSTNRRILSRQTQSWGFVPREVASGAEALALLDAGDPFDVAVIDVQMPGMDGYTLAAEIRRRRSAERLPIVALTSIGAHLHAFQGLDVAQVLTKPAKSAVLHTALHTVLQPKRATAVAPTAPSTGTVKLAELHPFRILLAEDVVINQRVALLLLGNLGYQAEVAANGLEVLAAVASQPFDIIFMDVQMPEMDGLACAQHLCTDYPLASARPWMIAMTANALEGDRQMCLDAGMDDYLTKPISGRSIADALTRAAQRHPSKT